jgi:hypothetical protein
VILVARITLRLPSELHQRAKELSEQQGLSLNEAIVQALESALNSGYIEARDFGDQQARLDRLRVALGEMVVSIDLSDFPVQVRPNTQMPDRDSLFNSLPVLSPPLSRTIIEERCHG